MTANLLFTVIGVLTLAVGVVSILMSMFAGLLIWGIRVGVYLVKGILLLGLFFIGWTIFSAAHWWL